MQELKSADVRELPITGPRQDFGSPRICGRSCIPSCQSTSTRIDLAGDAHECPIELVLMPSCMCCERAANGRRLLQTELCAHSTAHDRFQEWVKAAVFLELWQAGVERFDELCGIDWDWLSMDGAMSHPLL